MDAIGRPKGIHAYARCNCRCLGKRRDCAQGNSPKGFKVEPYIDVDVRIPKKNSEIIEYLKVLKTIKGPIYSIADDLKSLMLNFESHSNDRNMLAHAHMQVLPNWGATFSSYVAKRDKIGGDYFAYEERRLTLLQMDELARAATVLSHKAQAIRQKFLEHLE